MHQGVRAHAVTTTADKSSPGSPRQPPVAELVTVGDELLAGDIVDGNKATMAACLRAQGITVQRAVSLRDRVDEIAAELRAIALRADVCVVSGGLGPTTDDLTVEAVGRAAEVTLVRDEAAADRLREKFRLFGRPMPESNLKQADFPAGAEILPNPIGTAEGSCTIMPGPRGCRVFVMPGVPRELTKMLHEQVVPRLQQSLATAAVPRRIYRVLGHGESSVAKRIAPLLTAAAQRSPGLAATYVHYRASMPQVSVIVEATPDAAGHAATEAELASLDAEMIEALSPGIYGIGPAELQARVVTALSAAGLRLSCAESCTGGGLGALVTAVPGSSAAFRGGVIAYDNEIKARLLGVPEATLAEHGAVSEAVAVAMARGARDRLESDLGVGITGIAGPGGATSQKPVGTVHIAVVDRLDDGSPQNPGIVHRALSLRGNRGTVQRASAQWALKLVWDRLVARGLASIGEQ